jgi:hypothetical protein
MNLGRTHSVYCNLAKELYPENVKNFFKEIRIWQATQQNHKEKM